MGKMDEQHLQMEIDRRIDGARVVHLPADGYYALLSVYDSADEGIRCGEAALLYLGGSYTAARGTIVTRWEVVPEEQDER